MKTNEFAWRLHAGELHILGQNLLLCYGILHCGTLKEIVSLESSLESPTVDGRNPAPPGMVKTL